MQHVVEFERHYCRMPTVRELARTMGLKTSALREFIGDLISDEKSDETSVIVARLQEIFRSTSGSLRSLQLAGGSNVFLIDEDGTKLGVFRTSDAMQLARERGLDYILVQSDANPPVARLMERGRYKFEREKRLREIKRKHHICELKELRLRYEIDDHDYQVKLRSAQAFLKNGNGIKVSVTLRGRELEHADLALALLQRFSEDLSDLAVSSNPLKLEGRTAVLVLQPCVG